MSSEIRTLSVTGTVPFAANLDAVEIAGSRIWVCYYNGTNFVAAWTDDAVTWTEITVRSGNFRGDMKYDSANARMIFATGGENTASAALQHHWISSNVATGTPGAVSSITLDGGGSNAGTNWPTIEHTPTSSNPRYWIGFKKWVASTYSTDLFYVSSASTTHQTDTNWTRISNISNQLNANQGGRSCAMAYWQNAAAADRLTIVCGKDGPMALYTISFDPSAGTPTVPSGTALSSAATSGNPDENANGHMYSIAARNGYCVVASMLNSTTSDCRAWYSTDGATFTAYGNFTGSSPKLTTDGTDFYLVYPQSWGAASSHADTIKYRKITASGNVFGSESTFSDNPAHVVSLPRNTGTSTLKAIYRSSTGSPYSLRWEALSIAGGADTSPPGAASTVITAIGPTSIQVQVTLPNDSDVSQYEIRVLPGIDFPAGTRTDGTVAVSPTAGTPGQVVTHNITGLTNRQVYSGRVFVKDVSGNWNNGTSSGFQAAAVDVPTFVRRVAGDGVTTIPSGQALPKGGYLEYQLEIDCTITGGAPLFIRAATGTNNVRPPTTAAEILYSRDQPTLIQFKDSGGVWQQWPSSGLPEAEWGRLFRIKPVADHKGIVYTAVQVEQDNP